MTRKVKTVRGKAVNCNWTLYQADVLEALCKLKDDSVHCVVTSPPYWGLRAYPIRASIWLGDRNCKHSWGKPSRKKGIQGGHNQGNRADDPGGPVYWPTPDTHSGFCRACGAWKGVLGIEPTLELYLLHMVAVFREVHRVLRCDGTLWLNMGDAYAQGGRRRTDLKRARDIERAQAYSYDVRGWRPAWHAFQGVNRDAGTNVAGLKTKDLIGMPWRLALALQADGWYIRSDIIWHKPNPLPESVRDRPTKAHEYLFLLTKRKRYYYDQQAIREDGSKRPWNSSKMGQYPKLRSASKSERALLRTRGFGTKHPPYAQTGRNSRTVWTIPTQRSSELHFATFPEKLVEPCILAGTSEKGCCSSCRAPYQRIVARHRYATRRGNTGKFDPTGFTHQDKGRHLTASQTLGWERACTCKPHKTRKTIPCLVLDPFAGTSTTGIVALKHKRHFLGIELSSSYCRISKKRFAKQEST